ncbi:MAG: type II toxin-antitoxin system VapC family toxin [Methylobacter sp.]
MRLLLDTCIVYDWLMGEINNHLIIERIQTEGALVSSVTVWEMAIKNGLDKMPLPSARIAEGFEPQGFHWLKSALTMPKYEQLCVVTYDAVFQDYLDDVLFIRK